MARNVGRTAYINDFEILRSAAGLDDIKSMVIDSTKIGTTPTSGAKKGRLILEAGTVMAKIPASTKIQPVHLNAAGGSGGSGAYVAADIVGILETTIEFPPDVTLGAATDKEAAILHHGCDFNVAKLTGYTGNEAIVKAGLPTCIFR